MRTPFVESVLTTLIADDVLNRSDSVLAVCAGAAERNLFARLGLTKAVISNVDEAAAGEGLEPFDWSYQDATNLTFDDLSFEFSFVKDGLHHTSAPHRAVLEMYRVSRRGIIVIESRHSLLMRLANRMGLSPEYEIEAVIDHGFREGGLNNTDVPNYIYRWTESEFTKTIRSFDPVGGHTFRFFYGLNLPFTKVEGSKSPVQLRLIELTWPAVELLTRVFKKQCNSFAMVALKPRLPDDLWPWLALEDGNVHFNREYASPHGSHGR
jgi:SAM-dependent methyltransferase